MIICERNHLNTRGIIVTRSS